MKCPNCRCIVPESMEYCTYCGYRFEDGSARTVSVTEAARERLNSQAEYYYGYSQELARVHYPSYYYSAPNTDRQGFSRFSFEVLVTLMLGICAVLLLLIIALLVLFI